jgi:peptidoglycan hydrolase CwlO-like protein
MEKKFSFSQTLLAFAITFLAFSLLQFSLQVPAIIEVINKTTRTIDSVSPKIDDIVNEVTLVRAEVAKVRVLVSEQTPAILSQVEASLPVIQQVIHESEYYSRQIPALLIQLASIEKQVASLQKDMPSVLKRIDSVVKTTNNTTAEVARWRPHSTQYLEEIKHSREYIPKYLSRIENTVVDAKTVGSETSSGLVSGFFKGVISLPFDVVAGLAGIVDADSRSAENLTAKDIALLQEKVIDLLNDDKQSKSVWQNMDSGNRGTIIKGKAVLRNKQKCHNVTFNNHFGSEKETLKELMCLDDKGIWKVI